MGFQSIDCLVALLKDKNFDLLSLKMKEPNLFEALGIVRNEIRHSNFLAWLLDPYQNHGLGDIFIRRFLRDVFSDERVPQRSIIDADIIDLSKIEIRREWCHIDILIIIDNDIIVIENKIDSQDHSNQLMRYKNSVENTFSRKNIYKHYVYLTPLGTTPSEEIAQEFYINYSYSDIVAILSSILDIYEDNINNRARIYIEDYYRMIRRSILMNDELNDMAIKIYNSHKEALDFIFENRPDPASILYHYFEKCIKDIGWVVGARNKGVIRFLPKELMGLFPEGIGQGWPDKEIFMFEIDYYWTQKDAVFCSAISPSDDQDIRKKISDALEKSSFFQKAKGKKWLVNYRKRFKFCASDMVNEDEKTILARINHIIDEIKPVVNDFKKVLIDEFSKNKNFIAYEK